ncbi:MAG: Holliday junction branch migration protein RuvA [Moraxella sp.]
MIALIKGQVRSLCAPVVCILTNSGVGYEIELPIPDFCTLTLGDEVSLFTHLHIREDAQSLFGFIDQKDKEIFKKLIKINGVGAKMALAILSTLNGDELKHAIIYDDETLLIKVPGIGKKTAQRLIIELKDKLDNLENNTETQTHPDISSTNFSYISKEVESALLSLGYKEKEAQIAIRAAQKQLNNAGSTYDTASLLKTSLRQLSGL